MNSVELRVRIILDMRVSADTALTTNLNTILQSPLEMIPNAFYQPGVIIENGRQDLYPVTIKLHCECHHGCAWVASMVAVRYVLSGGLQTCHEFIVYQGYMSFVYLWNLCEPENLFVSIFLVYRLCPSLSLNSCTSSVNHLEKFPFRCIYWRGIYKWVQV